MVATTFNEIGRVESSIAIARAKAERGSFVDPSSIVPRAAIQFLRFSMLNGIGAIEVC
jgi:hypothetical protein